MHFTSTLLTALLAVDVALSSPTPAKRAPLLLKEDHPVPARWVQIGVPKPDHVIDLAIGFKNKKFEELERLLFEGKVNIGTARDLKWLTKNPVSDPRHARYGQHLSHGEVEDLQRPEQDAATAVAEWLEQHGITKEQCQFSKAGDWINMRLPVAKVEQMLDTTYGTYMHEDGNVLVRTPRWSLPEDLHEHIQTIQPTNAFLRAAPNRATIKQVPGSYDLSALDQTAALAESILYGNPASIATACNFAMVTTNCLRTLYNTINYTPKAPTKNTIGFTNYLGQITSRSDAHTFLEKNRPEAAQTAYTYREVSINGGPLAGSGAPGDEADLDVETILGIVYPENVTSYSTGGSPPYNPDVNTQTDTNEPYLTWLNYVQGRTDVPQTVSTSYGDDEQSVPLSYATSVCQGFAALGAKGHTLLFSSGDTGVGPTGMCTSNDGKNTTEFLPAFPASCPYITAVGATMKYPEVVAYDPTNGFSSGSGFSNYFPRPAYQNAVVTAYEASLNGANNGLYNKNGRAYPDVAAQGVDYAIIYEGSLALVDGTSCAAPTTSSVISLVNDALVAAGKAPLGFLNPLLYSGLGASAFNDVIAGNSIGCGTTGFPAQKGWDVASGWGTPDFVKILNYLKLSQ